MISLPVRSKLKLFFRDTILIIRDDPELNTLCDAKIFRERKVTAAHPDMARCKTTARKGPVPGGKPQLVSQPKQKPPKTPKPRKSAPSSGGVKKPKRYKAGIVALREIRRYQGTFELLMPKSKFGKLVRETANKLQAKGHCVKKDHRFRPQALAALQEAAEYFLVEIFEWCQQLAFHRKCVTITEKDLQMVVKIARANLSANLFVPLFID